MGGCMAVGLDAPAPPSPLLPQGNRADESSRDEPASHGTCADPCCNHHVHTKGRRPTVLTCEPGPGQTAVLNFSFCRRDPRPPLSPPECGCALEPSPRAAESFADWAQPRRTQTGP